MRYKGKATILGACLALVLACGPPRQTPVTGTWRQLQVAPLPQAHPVVELVPTCNVREFTYEVRYAGWYALLARYAGVEGIFSNTVAYQPAGKQTVYMEAPFIPFRVGWSADGQEPWKDASNTVDGWNYCQ